MTSREVYPVMLKNPALAYKIGKSGCWASDTTKVCWNVESASLSSLDTRGKFEGPSLAASDASDVLFDAAVNEVPDVRSVRSTDARTSPWSVDARSPPSPDLMIKIIVCKNYEGLTISSDPVL